MISEQLKAKSEKFNPDQISSFSARNAEKKFLGRLDLSLGKDPPNTLVQDLSLLSKEEEIWLFEALHFLKYRLNKRITASRTSDEKTRMMVLNYYAIRNRIVTANIGLVYHCYHRIKYSIINDKDRLLDGGFITLIKCAEGFDPWRGYRFNTYACRSLLRDFYKQIRRQKILLHLEPEPEDKIWEEESILEGLRLERLKVHMDENRANLTEIEQAIISCQYGSKQYSDLGHFTLKKTGKAMQLVMGKTISAERVRQIRNKAVQKIRDSLGNDPVLIEK